ncbi:DNA replication protein DnaD, partial [Mucilaginibacter lappiensis]
VKNSLEDFFKRKAVPVEEITVRTLYAYERYLSQPNYPLKQAFYQNRHVKTHQIRRLMEIKEKLSSVNINLFVASKADVEVPDLRKTLSALGFKIIRQSVPSWVVSVKNCFSYGVTDDTLLLYQR